MEGQKEEEEEEEKSNITSYIYSIPEFPEGKERERERERERNEKIKADVPDRNSDIEHSALSVLPHCQLTSQVIW